MVTKHVRPLFVASSLVMELLVIASLLVSALPTASVAAASEPAVSQTPQPPSTAQVTASINTNCRQGPSTIYPVVSYLLAGQSSPALSRLSDNSWWEIQDPRQNGLACWVWGGSTQLQGDVASVQAVAAPPVAYAAPAYSQYSAPYSYYVAPFSYSPFFFMPGFRFFRRRFFDMH